MTQNTCSIDYYNKNSKEFHERTICLDLEEIYQKFLGCLPKKGCILDAGCGIGRDSKFFAEQGHETLAFDGSLEMVKIASELLGKEVLHLLFHEAHFCSEFDAVWANASLLHIPYENLRAVFQSFHKALLPSGILYASFKYGSSMRQTEDRFFFDMNEASIEPHLQGLFCPLEIWKRGDTRIQDASPDKSWLHLIARRI